jgi:hypothetical protein
VDDGAPPIHGRILVTMTTVAGPDGRTWTVRRRWGRQPRWRQRDVDRGSPLQALDAVALSPSGGVADLVLGVVLLLVLGIVLAIIVTFVLPLLLFLAELVLLAAGAYALGRPWTIEATTSGPPPQRFTWRVRGWRRSRRAVEEVARELARGDAHVEPKGAE